MAARHLKRGAEGEEAAVAFLQKRGCKVLARNWRPGGKAGQGSLEIDVVCREKRSKALLFVEVKTRDAASMARPDQALNAQKRARLARAAGLYLSENDCWDSPCRFDLVCVSMGPNGPTDIELFQDVVRVDADGTDTWQPW